jgi:hypothetical protein
MKRTTIVVAIAGALGTTAVAGVTAAADANVEAGDFELVERPVDARAEMRHLENVRSTLDRAEARLVRLIEAGPPGFPPDPCADPRSISCREVQAVEGIDAAAEGYLASVAVLDNGTDRAALERRLAYSTATLAWASTRVASLASDWQSVAPVGYPPDPCTPQVVANVNLLASAAEFADRRIGRIDSCSNPASIDRRLGHVVAGLDGAAARLDKLAEVGFNPQPDPPGTEGGFNPQPDPPSPDTDAQLDAIIARAEYVALAARALKSTSSHISVDEPRLTP